MVFYLVLGSYLKRSSGQAIKTKRKEEKTQTYVILVSQTEAMHT